MEFKAVLCELDAMMSYFRSKVQSQDSAVHKAELALEEVLVNVIYHSGSPTLHLDCTVDPQGITLTVKDKGSPFNPLEERQHPNVDASLEEREVGGLGLFFMKKLVDDVSYTRQEPYNVLSFSKKLS
ncbi:MAG: hypothetical protein SP1CHLAM54_16430 [Chlamydiia bacterium]|nr:hypothetical protein [Chlamydiia bacterium]MCH9616532.1 hypothetical protein [Chlamydiia bacterium]MCH9629262.1 hypothetical protein [Chlamydiia bacterium]